MTEPFSVIGQLNGAATLASEVERTIDVYGSIVSVEFVAGVDTAGDLFHQLHLVVSAQTDSMPPLSSELAARALHWCHNESTGTQHVWRSTKESDSDYVDKVTVRYFGPED